MSLFSALMHFMFAPRTRLFPTVILFLLLMGAYLMTGSCFTSPNSSEDILTQMWLLNQFIGPSIIPLFLIYIEKMQTGRHVRAASMLWLIIPTALFTTALVQYILFGSDAINTFLRHFYSDGVHVKQLYQDSPLYSLYICNIVLYLVTIYLEVLILLVFLFRTRKKEQYRFHHLWNFLFKGGKIAPLELSLHVVIPLLLIFSLRLFVRREFIIHNAPLSLVFAALVTLFVFFFAYVALYSAAPAISIEDMRHSFRYNVADGEDLSTSTEVVHEDEADTQRGLHSLRSEIFSSDRHFPEDDNLRARFQHLMVDEELFLQPGLQLVDVAERLHSNKTYVSKLVNSTYNIGFPELLNTLRVDYAEQYILSHRTARQDEIAKACGFQSASSFNNIFKKVTGMTPKVWLGAFNQGV